MLPCNPLLANNNKTTLRCLHFRRYLVFKPPDVNLQAFNLIALKMIIDLHLNICHEKSN